ncbi:hypothetical protein LguiB_004275 [Lonicera macranthoides]
MTTYEEHLYSRSSSEYPSLFFSQQQNARWLNTSTSKPTYIFTPDKEIEIQKAVLCSQKHGLQIRVKSGGHDYEGQSFFSHVPYIIIDLHRFRLISINIDEETAWVQTGATLGELYYNIAQKSLVHAFPGGTCPSVGTGGLISGGGFGMLARKYGLAADNVLDAHIIDANGRVLDKKAMGKELFWAIRGGGGASFGVITAWKLKLVRVPPVVAIFTVHRRLNESATRLVHRWQYVANNLPKNILMRLFARRDGGSGRDEPTVRVAFSAQFLGRKKELMVLMKDKFPELRVKESDCKETSWINDKAKSDFVSKPIPEDALEGVWKRIPKEDRHDLYLIMDPFGGKNDEILESKLPFPYRKGTLYNIQYLINWKVNNATESSKCMKRMRGLYRYMKPFVIQSPRAAYVNYRDLELGKNQPDGTAKYSQAKVWGEKYFRANFKRLVQVKSKVDPKNFFRNEQSIPVILDAH